MKKFLLVFAISIFALVGCTIKMSGEIPQSTIEAISQARKQIDAKRVYMIGWRKAVYCFEPSTLSYNENLWQEKNFGYACYVHYYIRTQETDPQASGIVGPSTEWEVTKELFDQVGFGQAFWLPTYK